MPLTSWIALHRIPNVVVASILIALALAPTRAAADEAGAIEYEGTVYTAKLLWTDAPMSNQNRALRTRLAR